MNRIVLITGASSGYGKATAKAFKVQGDTVIMTARGLERLENACREVGGDLALQMDVTEPADWDRVLGKILATYGRLDILVNNAGGGVAIQSVARFSTEEIDKTIRLNLNSVIYGCRAVAPVMEKQKSGTVINISSVCARQCWPEWSVYAAAKAGVLNFQGLLPRDAAFRRAGVVCGSFVGQHRFPARLRHRGDHQLRLGDIADTVVYIANLPPRAVVEDVTVWGIDKQVNPL